MNKRRSFLKKMFAGLALSSLFAIPTKTNAAELNKSLIHMVYFWLKDPNDEKAIKKLMEGLHKMNEIETIQLSHIGTSANTAKRDVVDHSFTFSYMVVFANKEAHDIYQKHPVHVKFAEECKHLWTKVQVYDSVN